MVKPPHPSSLLDSHESDHLTKRDEIDILLAEYNRLSAHGRMYTENLSQKIGLFAIFVLSAFVFAFQNPAYQIIYVMIPFFIFFLVFLANAQSYMISLVAGRIKAIEERIKQLNEGAYIMEWESLVASKFIFVFTIRIKPKGQNKSRLITINPFAISLVFIIIPIVLLISYSSWRAYLFIQPPWNFIYLIFVGLFTIAMLIESLTFFIFGQISASTETIAK